MAKSAGHCHTVGTGAMGHLTPHWPGGAVAGFMPAANAGGLEWFTMPARPDQWLALACQLAGSTLSPAEWNTYIGRDHPYRNVC